MGVVGLQVAGLACHGWPIEPRLKFLVAQLLGLLPVQPDSAGVTGYLTDRGFGDAQCGANLALAEVAAVQQLQCLSHLAHGDP